MYKVEVFSINFHNFEMKNVGHIDLCSLNNFKPHYIAIYEIIQWQKSKKRKSNPHALTKGEVSYTNRKPFSQKGRGVARQGSLKNPHQRGGGVAFPPKGRNYLYKINKKKRKIALKSILFIRMNENRLIIFESFKLEKPSTKIVNNLLKSLSLSKALFVDVCNNELKLSTRNLRNAKFLPCKGINTLDVAGFPYIIFTKIAFEEVINSSVL